MPTKKIIPAIAIILLLASCSPTGTQAPLPTAIPLQPTETVAPTSTFTPSPTETPTSIPTETPIAVESLSGQLIFDMYHTGKVEYSTLSDAQRRELAVLSKENLLKAPSKLVMSHTWISGNTYEIGLTNNFQWARTDQAPASDFEGVSDKLPPSVAACYMNSDGELVQISENGEDYVVPRFNVDGPLAGMTLIDVANMSQAERKAAAVEMVRMVAEAMGASPERIQIVVDHINSEKYDFWPIFIDPDYAVNQLFITWADPENPSSKLTFPTTVVSSVITDESGAPIACVRIHQAPDANQIFYDVTAGETPATLSGSFKQPNKLFGKTGESVAMASFFGSLTSEHGSFLLRGGGEIGGVDIMRQLGKAKTIDQIRAVIRNIIINQDIDLFGDFKPR